MVSAPRDLRALKRRTRRRRTERGAVLFIVSMTLAVLAMLGGYALVASSNEIRSAGYARQSAQTHYLADFGVLGAAQNVNADTAGVYIALMSDATRRDKNCVSIPQIELVPSSKVAPCRRMGSVELARQWTGDSQRALAETRPFGRSAIKGDFFIEATEAYQTQPAPGNSVDLLFVQFTITSVGITQPNEVNVTSEQLYGNEGLEMARARITAGPLRR